MNVVTFSGFEESDLFGNQHIAEHATFVMPSNATLIFNVTDDDAKLSGDAHRDERGDDTSGQKAEILRDGSEIGNGGRLYAEQTWVLYGDDGNSYVLVELEQPGYRPDNFTFLGDVPAAGVQLTVGHPENVRGDGLDYDALSAGPLENLPNIVQIATGSDDFNILVQALSAANLVTTVQNASDITVFAPTDAAFTKLAVDLGFDGDETDEGAVFAFIAGVLTDLSPTNDPIPLLTDILLYHVSPGAKSAAEIDAADEITTLLSGATFETDGDELEDNEPDLFNPDIVIPDVAASNGTVQVIDRVLIPLDIPGNDIPTLAGVVAASGGVFDDVSSDFDLLFNAVEAAGLTGALDAEGADLTVFAPTDAAFVGLAQALGYGEADEGGAFTYLVEALSLLSNGGDPIPLLTQVLLYHVAPDALDAEEVLASDTIATLQGGSLGVDGASLIDADPDNANSNIIALDVPASNGIAHGIDAVLLPADLLQSDGSNDVDFVIADNDANTIRTGRDNDFVDGNGGRDLIWLGRGDDVGVGGGAGDHIRGGAGDDILVGGKGHDKLLGGKGIDTFVFALGDGKDIIQRYEDGVDLIDLSRAGITDFSEIKDGIVYKGYGAEINVAPDLIIQVRDRDVELTADDFLFA